MFDRLTQLLGRELGERGLDGMLHGPALEVMRVVQGMGLCEVHRAGQSPVLVGMGMGMDMAVFMLAPSLHHELRQEHDCC